MLRADKLRKECVSQANPSTFGTFQGLEIVRRVILIYNRAGKQAHLKGISFLSSYSVTTCIWRCFVYLVSRITLFIDLSQVTIKTSQL